MRYPQDTIPATQLEPGRATPVVGTITAARGQVGEPPHYTSLSVYYDILTTIPGTGTVTLTEQRSELSFWKDSGIWINAAALVGTSVQGYWIGGSVRWYFVEPPVIGDCGTAPRPGGNTTLILPVQGGVFRDGFTRPRGPSVDGFGLGSQTGGPSGAGGTGIE